MSLQFSDGMKFDTSGPLRIITRSDGDYVIGQGMLIPVNSREEGQTIIDKMKGKTSDKKVNESKRAFTTFESFDAAESQVKERAEGISDPAESDFVDEFLDVLYLHGHKEGDNYVISLSEATEAGKDLYKKISNLIGSNNPVNEENSLKDLVGKGEDEELDLDDARTIGKKMSKMHGDDRKKFVGIVNFMGASCKIYNEIWANYKPVDPERAHANKGKEYRGDKEIGKH